MSNTHSIKMPAFELGVDYYPEQCDPSLWEPDLRAISEAGMKWIRCMDFCWGRLEPSPGQFDLDWIDTVLDIASAYDLSVMLTTPTAGPPTWLTRLHPEVVMAAPGGQHIPRVHGGGGTHLCPHQPAFQQAADRIVTTVAQRFGEHPAVKCWQIDNEYMWNDGSDADCHCPETKEAFRSWLRRRWPDLHQLNEAWQTIAYSQPYADWQDINPPWPSYYGHTPSLILEWLRFRSQTQIDFMVGQADILRRLSPGRWLTHNYADINQLDCHELAKHIDVIGRDFYPVGASEYSPSLLAFQYQFLFDAGNRPFILPEFQVGSNISGRSFRPSEMAKLTAQARARGAFMCLYFQWRTPKASNEQILQGVLDPGQTDSSRLRQIRTMEESLPKGLFTDSIQLPSPKVGIVYHYDHLWSFSAEETLIGDSAWAEAEAVFDAYWQAGIPARIVFDTDDLADLQYIWIPGISILDETLRTALRAALENGSTVFASARSGNKDSYSALLPVQAVLSCELFGVTAKERDLVRQGMQMQSESDDTLPFDGDTLPVHRWVESLELVDQQARVLARHSGSWFSGEAAITSLKVGRGQAIYIGTAISTELAQRFVAVQAAHEPVPSGVESVSLLKDDQPVLLYINHNSEPVCIAGQTMDADKLCMVDDKSSS